MRTSDTIEALAEQVVRERIRANGPVTFAEFMAIALYDPQVGYYGRQAAQLGVQGDYYTSPELHPAFAALVLTQIEQVWEALDRPQPFVVHEAGPGSGIFARDLLDYARAARPDLYGALEYRLDEASPALRERQQRLLEREGHADLVGWVRSTADRSADPRPRLPTAPGQAAADGRLPTADDSPAHFVIANELLDALPVHLVQLRRGRLEELFVVERGGRLTLEPGPPASPDLCAYFDRLGLAPGEGCRAEVNLAALDWMRAAARGLVRGLLLVFDYGYSAEQLYRPIRRDGTLLCYYRHTLNSEPLARIGQQDLTTHVDFTSVRRAGEAAGLGTLGLVSQQRFLKNLGWQDLRHAMATAALRPGERDGNLRGLDELVRPDGLGRIAVLVQQRGLGDLAPIGLVGSRARAWPRLPLRGPDHLDLSDPAAGEGLPDFESQWAELWSD
jgi:SAM-dependent MidA family methyltransferase